MNQKTTTRESAMFVIQRGSDAGMTWPLEHKNLTIGRNAECDIVLDDRQVSRIHARVMWCGDHYELEDLSSKNGTHLNGRDVVGRQPLRDGDEIQYRAALQAGLRRCRCDRALAFGGPA